MNTKKSNCRVSVNHPELLNVLVDLALFTRKNQTPALAKALGITRQGLEKHIDKKEKNRKGKNEK